MEVSVIIINYNTTILTLACIESVYKYTKANTFEIILIDNASSDQSVKQIALKYPEVRVIYNVENVGFGKANNQGIKIAEGKYLFLLNSDTWLTTDAVKVFVSYMEDDHYANIACCGGALIKPDGSPQVSYGNFPSLSEALALLGPRFFLRQYFDKYLSSGVKVYKSSPYEVDYISGADLFIRKSVLNETGCFDEDFFLYFEETELAYRMWYKGYRSIVIPEVKIVHLEGGSHNETTLKKRIFASNRILFFKKCHGKFSAFLVRYLYLAHDKLSNVLR